MFEINFSKYGINSGIFLIIILLLSLVLCSCLGGKCSKKKHKEGMNSSSTPEQIPTNYTGTNSSTATLINNVVTTTNGGITDTFNAINSSSDSSSTSSCSTHKDCNSCNSSSEPIGSGNTNKCYWNNTQDYNSGEFKESCGSWADNPIKCSSSPTPTTATEFVSKNTKNTARLTNRFISYNSETNKDTLEYTITVTHMNNSTSEIYTAFIEIAHPTPPPPPPPPGPYPPNGGGNYNHYIKIQFPDTYYSNGKTLRVFYDTATGVYYITVVDPVTGTINYTSTTATNQASLTKYIFTAPNGATAVVYAYNGSYAAKVTDVNGVTTIYTTTGSSSSNNSEIYTNSNTNANTSGSVYTGPNATVYTTTTPSYAYNNGYDYSTSEPQGVSRTNIPDGDEDLYMLKSQVVPPVCPTCPGYNRFSSGSGSGSGDKPPPCPACARCPQPAFNCKKVPNYKTIKENRLPNPIINSSYSTYGL